MSDLDSVPNPTDNDNGLVFACLLDGKGAGKRLDWEGIREWQQGADPIWIHLDRTSPGTRDWLADEAGLLRLRSMLCLKKKRVHVLFPSILG